LAYVPVELLKCVVFLGYINEAGKEKFGGSAFWISRPGPDDLKHEYRPAYLVTAAHVIKDMQNDMAHNDTRVRIRVNLVNGGQTWIDTSIRFWKFHPDYPNVDLAVLKTELDNSTIDHAAWPLEFLIKKDSVDENLSDRRVGLGDELFFAGLFWPHKGENRNIPVVRIGNVAALREEPVLNRDGHLMDAYLVESRSIGGLSGSPVFFDLFTAKRTQPPTWGYMAAAHANDSPSRFPLFGIVHGHFDWEDKEPDTAMDRSQKKLGVNMGIAIVIPAEKIIDLLDQFGEEEEKEADEFRERKRSLAIVDTRARSNVTIGIAQTVSTGFEVPPSKPQAVSDSPKKASGEQE